MKQTEIGLIPDDWEVKTLGEVASLQRGFDLPLSEMTNGEYPVVFSNGINAFHNQFKVKAPGVVTGRSGTIGSLHYVEKNYWPHNTTLWVTDFHKNYPKYIFYLFQTINWKSYSGGSGVPTLNRNDVHEQKLLLPPLPEQQRIAKALSDVDVLISTTEKLIQKKKNIKQGTMQNLLTGKKRLPGFAKSTNYKQSELGPIPEDWEVIKISGNYFLKGRIGWQGLKASEFKDKGPYLVTGTDFYNGRVNWKTCYHITEERYAEDKALHVNINDILITKDGTVGKVAYIDNMPEKVSLNSHLLIIRPLKEKLINRYLYYVFNSKFFFNYYQQTQTGTTMASLSQDKISKFAYPLPSKEEQTAIAKVFSCMDKEIETLNTKLEKYRNLKTAMMQQLLTGKIRLK